jgi:hypothetical protein
MGKIMKKWTPLFACIFIVMTSCVSELDKYYATPDWLKGNSWEVLDKKGNYKLFLSAVERTSYKDLVQGKGIITVMAPTDSAFQVYLSKHNYASVAAIPDSVVTKLVGFQLLFYSFDKQKFEDYKPGGIESTNPIKGMYYKYRTKSRDDISVDKDPAYKFIPRKVIHNDRFIPVLSYNFFTSFGIKAKENYEFFYPNSTWTGDNGFNASNASVLEYATVTDNGYVYSTNQVVEPLETIYKQLNLENGYDIFRKAYDRFKTFQYDATSTANYGKGDSVFIMNHGTQLAPIASEWPVPDYNSLSILSFAAYNLFAPDNSSMQAFYDTYWRPYYKDKGMDSIRFEPLLALLQNHNYSSTILFPEQIERGAIKSPYGSAIQFNRAAAKMKHICVNGSLYGLDHVIVPPMFDKVTSPMYCNPKYTMFLDMMKNASYVQTLISDVTKFKVFYPSDSMITVYSNLDGKNLRYVNTNNYKYGAQEVQIDGDNGFQTMSVNQKKTFAGSHVATELISSRGTTESVYRTFDPYNYIYINGTSVYSSSIFNSGIAAKVPTMKKIEGSWTNGEAYELTGATATALTPEYNQFKNVITSITSPADYSTFKLLINSSGLAAATPPFSFLQGERFIVLIPTNAAITAGLTSKKIPVTPADKVASYLKPYFINVSASSLLDYPFPGAGVQGTLVSFGKKSDGTTATFTLVDRNNELVIIDAKGNEAHVLSYFPRIYADGAAYVIDKLLEIE